MSGRSIPGILGKGWGFPGIRSPPTFDLYGQPRNCLGSHLGPIWFKSVYGMSSGCFILKVVPDFLVAQTVKHLSTMGETRVRSLGWEDPLEKEMAIHSSTIAWKIPWTEEPTLGRLQSMGSPRVIHDRATSPLRFCLSICIASHAS